MFGASATTNVRRAGVEGVGPSSRPYSGPMSTIFRAASAARRCDRRSERADRRRDSRRRPPSGTRIGSSNCPAMWAGMPSTAVSVSVAIARSITAGQPRASADAAAATATARSIRDPELRLKRGVTVMAGPERGRRGRTGEQASRSVPGDLAQRLEDVARLRQDAFLEIRAIGHRCVHGGDAAAPARRGTRTATSPMRAAISAPKPHVSWSSWATTTRLVARTAARWRPSRTA